MRIDVFKRYQEESNNPYKCINLEHEMLLVPYRNLDDVIEFRCFVSDCDFKIIPGSNFYNKILKEYGNE